jgi:O-antigen/teichoic acid export membrane protein
MMASQGTVQLLGLLTSVGIARLLSPREVGLAAEAVVFGSLALFITDFGVASVIVQRPSLTEVDKSTAFWTSVLMGVVMTVIGIGLSWPIAILYGQPRVQGLFAVLSLTFLLTAPGIVQGALLTRELRFRQLETRTIIASSVSSVTAIVLALAGFGPWAIIAQSLTVSGVSTVLLWRSSAWRPQAVFSRQSLGNMAGFASRSFGARALSWGVWNVDNILVGGTLGAAPLGAYSLACSVALSPMKRIATPITQVLFPAFSRMREGDQIAAAWLRALRVVALIVTPVMLGVVVVAPDLVPVVFGAKWLAAVPVLQLLAVVGLLLALTALNTGILQSLGHTRTLLRSTLMVSVGSIIGFAAGLPFGITGVAATYLLASLVVQPLFMSITARTVGVTLRDCLRSISGVLQAGLGMMALVLGGRELLLAAGVPAVGRLILMLLWGALVYAALIAWRAPEIKRELGNEIGRRRAASVTPEHSEAPA